MYPLVQVKQVKTVDATSYDSESLVKSDAFQGIFEIEEVAIPKIKPGEVKKRECVCGELRVWRLGI